MTRCNALGSALPVAVAVGFVVVSSPPTDALGVCEPLAVPLQYPPPSKSLAAPIIIVAVDSSPILCPDRVAVVVVVVVVVAALVVLTPRSSSYSLASSRPRAPSRVSRATSPLVL